MNNLTFLTFNENGSVTDAAGFQASGITCGLKKSGNKDAASRESAIAALKKVTAGASVEAAKAALADLEK